VIAIPELTFQARKINVESFRVIETWTVASLLYVSTCLSIAALLRVSPSPSEEQIDALPNICRCGAYPRIRKAIARAAQLAVPGAPALQKP